MGQVILDEAWLRILPQMLNWQRTFKVDGAAVFKNGRDSATIVISKTAKVRPAEAVALPTPQYQYEVYQGVGNNRAGFDMTRAHPMLPA